MNDYRLLSRLRTPDDIKRLSISELTALAGEIRHEIIETVSENGGHLASNLGTVEAILALHTVFNIDGSPDSDSLIFDVGHQCYAHKLITGRFDRFRTLRRFGGISGFSNRDESPYDTVTCGHSGSSVSTAVGIAEANRIRHSGDNDKTPYAIAFVGDGSFSNGMIYEALNGISGRNLRLVIVLNDNEMSISKNVGGFSDYLSYIRTSEQYFTFKTWLKRIFSKIPLVGEYLIAGARAVRDLFKRIFNAESLFENLGLNYIGPVNGNDLARTIHVLEEAKAKSRPVVVHIKTKKGLGYSPAELRPDIFHSAPPFNAETGTPKSQKSGQSFTNVITECLAKSASADPRICAITAAMRDGCGLNSFAAVYPDRFFDVGIAEEHAVTMAGGLAIGGLTPVIFMYSTFAQRTFDQLWHDVCLQKTHVILCLSHCGIVPGDGVTHQGIYDVALLKSIPGVSVFSPDTARDAEKSFAAAVAHTGLCVVRYPKDAPVSYDDTEFVETAAPDRIFKTADFPANTKPHTKIAVITYGRIAKNVASALSRLADSGISSKLIVLTQLLPLPISDIRSIVSAAESEHTFVVEEAAYSGGLGETIAAELPVSIIAIDDPLIPHGSVDELFALAGLTPDAILRRITDRLNTVRGQSHAHA